MLHPEDMFAASFMHLLCYVMFMHAASERQVSGQRGPKSTPGSIQRDPVGHWAWIPLKKPVCKVPEPSDVFQTIQKMKHDTLEKLQGG